MDKNNIQNYKNKIIKMEENGEILRKENLEIAQDYRNQISDLLKDKEFMRKVFDSLPALIFIKDNEGRYIFVNESLAKLFGMSVEEVEGKKDSDFINSGRLSAEEVKKYIEADKEVISLKTEKYITERGKDLEGNTIYLQTTKFPLIWET